MSKILILLGRELDDQSGMNTIQNFFSSFSPDDLSLLYLRSNLPNTNLCTNFFQISEILVLKKIISKKVICGRRVENNFSINSSIIAEEESKFKRIYKKYNSIIFSLFREFIWKTGVWKEDGLDIFLKETNPDYIFASLNGFVFHYRVLDYITFKLKKKVVIFFADDNLTFKSVGYNPISLFFRWRLRRHIIAIKPYIKRVFVASPLMKKVYDNVLGLNTTVLLKGINVSNLCFNTINSINKKEINILYAGNLLYGRDNTLFELALFLGSKKYVGPKCVLHIYTQTNLNDDKLNAFHNTGACIIHGFVSYPQLVEIRNKTDFLVFVESFIKKDIRTVWLSLSTKIMEYLSTGKPIIAIGPSFLAPIQFLSITKTAFVVDNLLNISSIQNFISSDILKNDIIKNMEFVVKNNTNDKVAYLMHSTLD